MVSLWGSGTSRIYTLAKMKAAASGSAGKSFTSPWRMENFRPGNSRSVVLVIFIVGEYTIPHTRRSGGHGGASHDSHPLRPAHTPGRALVLGLRESLEDVLNGTANHRDRAGLAQPRAATLHEERPIGLAPGIAREKMTRWRKAGYCRVRMA